MFSQKNKSLVALIFVLAILCTVQKSFAQNGINYCGSPHRASYFKDGGFETLPPLYRGKGATGIFENYLPPFGFETSTPPVYRLSVYYSNWIYWGDINVTIPPSPSNRNSIRFTVPSNMPTGTMIFRVLRRSEFQFGVDVSVRNLDFCQYVEIEDAPNEINAIVNGASFNDIGVAPNAIASAFGVGLTTTTATNSTIPLPTIVGNTRVEIQDSAGQVQNAPIFYVSPLQVNFLIPENISLGRAKVTIIDPSGKKSVGSMIVYNVAPGLFTQNSNGEGVPSGYITRVRANGSQTNENISFLNAPTNSYLPAAINLGNDDVYLILFGTGIRYANSVTCKIGGVDAQVTYSGAQPNYVGLDQVNVRIPSSLAGRGEVDVVLRTDGINSKAVKIKIQ